MKTQQPIWRYRGNLGDASPLTEHGAFLYEDKTGVYDPELVLFDAPTKPKGKYRVSRIVCTKCYFTNGVFSDNRFHKDSPAWFDPADVARSRGLQTHDLIACFCSDDVITRAMAYQGLAGHHGVYELDQYPADMTRAELRRRYPAPFRNGSYPV